MHGHVPALEWIIAVGSYRHSSFLKHLLCCKRTKKKIDLLLMSVSVSSAIRTSQEGSHGGFWLMCCAEIQWWSSRKRRRLLTRRKTLKWTLTIQNPNRRHIWEQREEEKKRLKTVHEVHVQSVTSYELAESGKVHQVNGWLVMLRISCSWTFSGKNKWLKSLQLFLDIHCAFL